MSLIQSGWDAEDTGAKMEEQMAEGDHICHACVYMIESDLMNSI